MLWAVGARWQVVRAQLEQTVASGSRGAGVPGSLSHLRTPGPPCLPGPHLYTESGPAQPVHPGLKSPFGAQVLWSPRTRPDPPVVTASQSHPKPDLEAPDWGLRLPPQH